MNVISEMKGGRKKQKRNKKGTEKENEMKEKN